MKFRKSLYYQYVIGYLIFLLVGFLAIFVVISRLSLSTLTMDSARSMYDCANDIASSYGPDLNNEYVPFADVANILTLTAAASHMRIQVISIDGEIYFDSEDSPDLYNTARLNRTVPTIDEFDISYFSQHYYQQGTFYGTFKEKTLSVYAPIIAVNKNASAGQRKTCYVILHSSLNTIVTASDKMMDYVYLTFFILFALSLILLLIFTFFVFIPLQKIIRASKEYAKGNFKYQSLNIPSDNEMGILAASLNFMANELDHKAEDQKKFIANISHDFRSPLTSIKGYVEALLDGTIPGELYPKYLKTISAETDRLTKLTNNLLELNKWDNRGNLMDYADFDINMTIRNLLPNFEGRCFEKKIQFDIVYEAKNYYVYADIGKIQQVLYNLIDNALKFSYKDSKIYIHVFDKLDKVYVSIRDTGIGIPQESLHKIWERFYKTDTSRGKDKTGTGLGLAIVKEIMLSHEENIEVFSSPEHGTEFIFSLKKAKR